MDRTNKLLAALLVAAWFFPVAVSGAERPNVVLIIADDLGLTEL